MELELAGRISKYVHSVRQRQGRKRRGRPQVRPPFTVLLGPSNVIGNPGEVYFNREKSKWRGPDVSHP